MSEFRLGRSEYWFDPTASKAVARADRRKHAKIKKEASINGQDKPFSDSIDSVYLAKGKEAKKRRGRGFTDDELVVLDFYENLVVSEEAYLDIREQYFCLNGESVMTYRPFLNRTVLTYLGLEGLKPFRRGTRKELGRVWGFYQLERKFNEDIDLIARHLRIHSEVVNSCKLLPGQKFEIYTRALLLCFSDEVLAVRCG